jgi:UDP-N-acetylglucosamine 1-carboxyvinyltransferase
MDKIVIRGGRRLSGEVAVSGAKNAALPLVAATLLAEGEHRLRRVPDLADLRTMGRLCRHMGAEVARGEGDACHELSIRVPAVLEPEAPYELVKTMRASVLVLGPLAARVGRARVSLPGGCAIGARPIDQHLKGLSALGADIRLSHGYVEVESPQLRGAEVHFDLRTVTGTENVMMAATLARGQTVLRNAAVEPEVVDLAQALGEMGAKISGAGTPEIEIEGVEGLRPLDHEVIGDRIEAGTLMAAVVATGGEVILRRCPVEMLVAAATALRRAGAKIESLGDGSVKVTGPNGRPKPIALTTEPHPGFPTDMQAQLMALLCVARGDSRIEETVFENRFMHVLELTRMGARIEVDGNVARLTGVETLSGAQVMATDLRASASLVIAGLLAEGQTEVHRVYHLDRGYERLEEKLRSLGADVRRVPA